MSLKHKHSIASWSDFKANQSSNTVMCRGKDKTNSSLNPIITWSDHSRDPYINNHNNNTLYHSLSLITKSH